jgi:hypothetical protein
MEGYASEDSKDFRSQLLGEQMLYDRLIPLGLSEEQASVYDHLGQHEPLNPVNRLSVAQDASSPVGYVWSSPTLVPQSSNTASEPQWQYSAIAQSVDSVLEPRAAESSVRLSSHSSKPNNSSAATTPTADWGNANQAFADFRAANAAGGALAAQTVREDCTSPDPHLSDSRWRISVEDRQRYEQQFRSLKTSTGFLSGATAREFFLKSKLPNKELSAIWKLSDVDGDGQLSLDEFCIAVHIVIQRRKGAEIPSALPAILQPKKENFDIESAFDELKATLTQQTVEASAQAFQPIPVKSSSGGSQLPSGQGVASNVAAINERNEWQTGFQGGQPKKHVSITTSHAVVQPAAPMVRRQTEPNRPIHPHAVAQKQKTVGDLSDSKLVVLENPMVRMATPSSEMSDIQSSKSDTADNTSQSESRGTSPENDGFPLMPPSLPAKRKTQSSVALIRLPPDSPGKIRSTKSTPIEETARSETPPPPIEKPVDLLTTDGGKQFVKDFLTPPSLPPKKKAGVVKRSKSHRDRTGSSSKTKRRQSKEKVGYSQLDDDASSLGDTGDAFLLDSQDQQIVHDLVNVVAPEGNVSHPPDSKPQLSPKPQPSPRPRQKGHSRSSSLDLKVVLKSKEETDGINRDAQPFMDLPPAPPPKEPPAVPPKRKPRKPAPEPPSSNKVVEGVSVPAASSAGAQVSPYTRKGHKKSASLDILSTSPDLRDLTRVSAPFYLNVCLSTLLSNLLYLEFCTSCHHSTGFLFLIAEY